VIEALAHRSTDTVPYDIRFTKPAAEAMADHYGDPDFESKLGNCLNMMRACRRSEVRPDVWQDEFGVEWDRSVDRDIGVVVNTLVTPETLDEYVFPDPDDPMLMEEIEKKALEPTDALNVVKLSYSLFERAWSLAGMTELLMAMVDNKGFVHELMDGILEYNLRLIRNVCRRPVDAIYFGDDWGQQTGLTMGPDLWREFIAPRAGRLYMEAKSNGKYVFIHCCGQITEIIDDLIELGVDCFNPLQPEVMDVADIKRRYGGRLSFYGGISTQKTLPFGTVREVEDEVGALLRELGDGGGYIASPAHAIPPDARPENVAAMIDILRGQ
jgi:uroporphyrinogen decarboxylase